MYEKLPRGPAPETQAKGLLGRYRKRYIDGKGSAMRKSRCTWATSAVLTETALVHLIAFFGIIGYAQNYYFHLRKSLDREMKT